MKCKPTVRRHLELLVIPCLVVSCCTHASDLQLIIAHRGASGYLPEHTLESKAMAHAYGADYIEQDIVLSRDDHAVILHDIYLDTVTDVALRFPGRSRDDGRFYVIDFTLAEMKSLRVTERFDPGNSRAVFPQRFPLWVSDFRIHTLAEEIELIQGLNRSTGREAGIYPEIKAPAWHREHGRDISKAVLDILDRYGYRDRNDAVYLQCFDAAELRRIRHDLHSDLKLIQLVSDRTVPRKAELRLIKKYADGIGPPISSVIPGRDAHGLLFVAPFVSEARELGLQIHPYTLRADDMPDYAPEFVELMRVLLKDAGADGLFTDHPDRARQARDQLESDQVYYLPSAR